MSYSSRGKAFLPGIGELAVITVGSFIYALATVLFIFPHSVVMGGTSGIAVIVGDLLSVTPSVISVILNLSLIVLAFIILGRGMAVKTLIGSLLTTVFIGALDGVFALDAPLVYSDWLSALIGAVMIAVASGFMFYVDSSSGGTDIVALILKKYVSIPIGRALLVTDVLIVIVGGLLAGWHVLLVSALGFLIKTLGIDAVIGVIRSSRRGK